MAIKYKKSVGSIMFDVANTIILFLFAFIMIYPFIWVISTSLSDPIYLSKNIIKFFPVGIQFTAYKFVIQFPVLWISYYNTVQYAVVGTLITVLICSLVAYVLSIKSYKLRKVMTIVFILTMFFHGGMVPTYLLISQLHLLNTIWAIVLPPAISLWYIIILRTSFSMISNELREAAQLDGANDFRIYWQIIMPLSKATLATIVLFAAVGQWNNFFAPLLYLSDSAKYPLTIFLRNLVITESADSTRMATKSGMSFFYNITAKGGARGIAISIRMAAIVLTILPIVCVYPFVQKYFVKGVLIGGVKG